MHKNVARWPMVLVALLVALVPSAEASIPLLPDVCAAMAKAPVAAAGHSCCGTSCDCSIETQKSPVSQDVPVSQPRIELSFTPLFDQTSLTGPVEHSTGRLTAQESPPKDTPLYEEYSEYRL